MFVSTVVINNYYDFLLHFTHLYRCTTPLTPTKHTPILLQTDENDKTRLRSKKKVQHVFKNSRVVKVLAKKKKTSASAEFRKKIRERDEKKKERAITVPARVFQQLRVDSELQIESSAGSARGDIGMNR